MSFSGGTENAARHHGDAFGVQELLGERRGIQAGGADRRERVERATGLAWSSQHEADGRVTWICPTCTRAQLWLIEAGLTIATAHAPARAVPLPSAA